MREKARMKLSVRGSWNSVSSPSLRLDTAIADKRISNIHGLVVLRDDQLIIERYFEGPDRARGRLRPAGGVDQHRRPSRAPRPLCAADDRGRGMHKRRQGREYGPRQRVLGTAEMR